MEVFRRNRHIKVKGRALYCIGSGFSPPSLPVCAIFVVTVYQNLFNGPSLGPWFFAYLVSSVTPCFV